MIQNIYKLYISILSLILIFSLSACATTQYKNIDNAGLNIKQQDAMILEITNILKQNYPMATYRNIGLSADAEMSKQLIKNLKLNGYVIDEPSKDNLKFKYYITKLDESRIILSLYMGDMKASKIYMLKAGSLISNSSLTMGM